MTWAEYEDQLRVREVAAARERQRVTAAEEQRANQIRQQEQIRNLIIQQMYSQFAATTAEQARILSLITQNCPERRGDVVKHFQMLNDIRTLTEASRTVSSRRRKAVTEFKNEAQIIGGVVRWQGMRSEDVQQSGGGPTASERDARNAALTRATSPKIDLTPEEKAAKIKAEAIRRHQEEVARQKERGL
jgi:hypothetical protein